MARGIGEEEAAAGTVAVGRYKMCVSVQWSVYALLIRYLGHFVIAATTTFCCWQPAGGE